MVVQDVTWIGECKSSGGNSSSNSSSNSSGNSSSRIPLLYIRLNYLILKYLLSLTVKCYSIPESVNTSEALTFSGSEWVCQTRGAVVMLCKPTTTTPRWLSRSASHVILSRTPSTHAIGARTFRGRTLRRQTVRRTDISSPDDSSNGCFVEWMFRRTAFSSKVLNSQPDIYV